MNLIVGETYLLDGKQQVIVLKPLNKAAKKYVVETPGRTVMVVESERLSSGSSMIKMEPFH